MRIWTEGGDAVFTRTVPESADCFLWEDIMRMGDFLYFLQTGECAKENRSKIKVSKWIDTPDLTAISNLPYNGMTCYMPWKKD